jgi:hypothetical protein
MHINDIRQRQESIDLDIIYLAQAQVQNRFMILNEFVDSIRKSPYFGSDIEIGTYEKANIREKEFEKTVISASLRKRHG